MLALLIEQGMRYVILAPDQAKGKVDTSKPYLFRHPDGSSALARSLLLQWTTRAGDCFREGADVEPRTGGQFIRAAQAGDLVNVATDGETYGHHFKFGDLCLAHALEVEAKEAGFWITNYARVSRSASAGA